MTTIAAKSPLIVKYGASELKEIIARNTKRAFVYTMLLLLLLALFTFTYKVVESFLFPPPNVVKVLLTRISIDALAPPPSENANEPPPPPPPQAVPPAASGPAARAGTPVAVPDALIAPDAKDFANIDEINRATSVGGDGKDLGGWSDGTGVDPGINIQQRDELPDPDDFISVERDPVFDLEDLQRRVVYPNMARVNGIQGTVRVRVLVGKDGKVLKTMIIESDNRILNQAAEDAVKATVFTPALQNGHGVAVWMAIPVKFRLR
ncbi:MAG: energy transducer TonB [Ignavibacteria bacterium]|nr:energy transducer TonB [Ignavibacteria bacterium]